MKRATAYANANIALIKYWGKNDSKLNTPAVSSLSMTLSDLGTLVTVSASGSCAHSSSIDGRPCTSDEMLRVVSYLEQVRQLFPYEGFLQILSKSSIPYAAGLASSASYFAALSVAINDYLDLRLDGRELSKIARIGSGSAARSVFGGLVGLYGGLSITHDESYAFPIVANDKLDLSMVLAIVSNGPKAISSRVAMNATKSTSPFFAAFVQAQERDFKEAIAVIREGSFERLGVLMEHSTLKMHATMWTARPAINYWLPTTLAVMDLVYEMRKAFGPVAYFTMDAGPNVKILCQSEHVGMVIDKLRESTLVSDIRSCPPGSGAQSLSGHLS